GEQLTQRLVAAVVEVRSPAPDEAKGRRVEATVFVGVRLALHVVLLVVGRVRAGVAAGAGGGGRVEDLAAARDAGRGVFRAGAGRRSERLDVIGEGVHLHRAKVPAALQAREGDAHVLLEGLLGP